MLPVMVEPPSLAVIVAVVIMLTVLVPTWTTTPLAPGGTVTVDGTVIGPELVSVMTSP